MHTNVSVELSSNKVPFVEVWAGVSDISEQEKITKGGVNDKAKLQTVVWMTYQSKITKGGVTDIKARLERVVWMT